jgi:hypothetical protein
MREKKYFLAIKLTIGDIDMAHQWNKRRKVETNRANKDDVDKVAGAGYRDVKATDQQHCSYSSAYRGEWAIQG